MTTYTKKRWLAEYAALDAGADPASCPSCDRTGFYGPRGERPAGTDARRACKFCGRWQRIGEDSFFAVPTVHSCRNGPTILGAPQIWWELPDKELFDCPTCKAKGLTIEHWRTEAPRDDPDHPWWRVPHGLSQEAYKQWWRENEPWVAAQLAFGYL